MVTGLHSTDDSLETKDIEYMVGRWCLHMEEDRDIGSHDLFSSCSDVTLSFCRLRLSYVPSLPKLGT